MRAARIVANQTKLIEQLRADGQPTGEAEAHLAVFRDALQAFEDDLAVADKACRTLLSRGP
jgi:hypothetical protein